MKIRANPLIKVLQLPDVHILQLLELQNYDNQWDRHADLLIITLLLPDVHFLQHLELLHYHTHWY